LRATTSHGSTRVRRLHALQTASAIVASTCTACLSPYSSRSRRISLRDTTEPLSTSTPPRKAQPASGARNRAQHQRALRQHLGVAAVRYVRGDRHGFFMPAPWRGGLTPPLHNSRPRPAARSYPHQPRRPSIAQHPPPKTSHPPGNRAARPTAPTPQHALGRRRVPPRSELINSRLGSSETRGPRSGRRVSSSLLGMSGSSPATSTGSWPIEREVQGARS